jgi:thioredoxin 1
MSAAHICNGVTLIKLSNGDFESEIGNDVCIVDFYADWCGPCRQVTPIMAELEELGMRVFKVDIDENRSAAEKFGIRSIPTVIIMADGKPIKSIVGAVSKQDYLDAYNSVVEDEDGKTKLG